MRFGLACTRDGSAVYFIGSDGRVAYRWLRDRPDLSTFDPDWFVNEKFVAEPALGGVVYWFDG
jgi:hypothetical protein